MPKLYALGLKSLAGIFFSGPDGVLRISRRGLDPAAPPYRPECLLTTERPIEEGEVVKAEIPLNPLAMRIHRGESLTSSAG